MSGTTFEERLLPMLRETVEAQATERRRGRRRRRIVLSAAVLGGLLLVGGTGAIAGRDVVAVSGIEALRDPRAVERQLRAADIEASIVAVPLPRAGAGQQDWHGVWWWVTADRPMNVSEEEFAFIRVQTGLVLEAAQLAGSGNTRILELPTDIDGHLTLFVGYEASPGEFTVDEYGRTNELAPTGAFYCLPIDASDPAGMDEVLSELGYDVRWTLESRNAGVEVDVPPGGTVVTWAWLPAPNLVDARVSPVGAEADEQRAAEGTYLRRESPPWEAPCPVAET